MDTIDSPTLGRREAQFGRRTPLIAQFRDSERTDTPLLVFLPGGAYDHRYFDAPGRSAMEQANDAGFPVVALNRPGYPADADSARAFPTFAEAAEVTTEAVADAWDKLGRDRPGVVLCTHSLGGAIGIHMAAEGVPFPLLGLALSGIGHTLTPFATELMSQLPPGIIMDFPFELQRPLLYGPDWTLDPSALADLAELILASPTNELLEVATTWADQLVQKAPLVMVPVYYALAEFDGLWPVSPELVDQIARSFTGAPFVEASMWRGAGHNIEHHTLGGPYVSTVLAFAERCVVEGQRPAPAS